MITAAAMTDRAAAGKGVHAADASLELELQQQLRDRPSTAAAAASADDSEAAGLLFKDKPVGGGGGGGLSTWRRPAGSSTTLLQLLCWCILATCLALAWVAIGRARRHPQHQHHSNSLQQQQQQPAAPRHQHRHRQYANYYASNSTIPGAGVGLFARHALPASTVWNREDAGPDGSIILDGCARVAWRCAPLHAVCLSVYVCRAACLDPWFPHPSCSQLVVATTRQPASPPSSQVT